MRILTHTNEISNLNAERHRREQTLGFVPTMGALHLGHLSLVDRAKRENDLTVCSIFVNAAQFNDPEDFEKYPRHLDADLALLQKSGCDVAFVPEARELFSRPDSVKYELTDLAEVLEGKERPGHFNGVASVVKRLFEVVQPERAYFGLKDYQQYLIIKKLTERYALGVDVVGCPTVREVTGLARSSRNLRLSPEARRRAARLYQSLCLVREHSSERSSTALETQARTFLSNFPDIHLEYIKVVNPETLAAPKIDDGSVPRRVLLAARIDGVRLIDNMEI